MSCWTTAFCALVTNDTKEFPYIDEMSSEDSNKFKVIMSRLSRTPPPVMFGSNIKQSHTPTTNISKAWYAATTALGSRYVKVSINLQQTTLAFRQATASPKTSSLATAVANTSPAQTNTAQATTASPATQVNQGSDQAATTSPATGTTGAAQVSPSPTNQVNQGNSASPSNNGSTIRPNQLQYTTQLTNSIRVIMKVKIPSLKEGKTPNTFFLNHIKGFLEVCKEEDPSAQILPWKSEDKVAPGDIISTAAQIPSKLADFQKYTHRATPKNNSVVWWKMRYSCNGNPSNIFLSNADSSTKYWFDNAGSYRCTVQNSWNTIDLGDALYSGGFCNAEYMKKCIQTVALQTYKKELRFGIRVKKNQEIQVDESSKGPGGWLMQANQLLHLEVDRADDKLLKNILYNCFNKTEDRMKRPGYYAINFLPEKTQMKTCYASGTRMRQAALKKHQAIVSNVVLIKNTNINELNLTYTLNGEKWSCRKFLLT